VLLVIFPLNHKYWGDLMRFGPQVRVPSIPQKASRKREAFLLSGDSVRPGRKNDQSLLTMDFWNSEGINDVFYGVS